MVRTPFIFLTAKADATDLRRAMNLGADDYLTKPFQISELLTAIESRLRHKQQRENSAVDYLTTIQGSTGRGSMVLRTEDCLYFFTHQRSYFVIHPLGTLQINSTLEELSAQLNPVHFFRANRKEIVNRNTIQRYAYWEAGKYCLFLTIGQQTKEVILPRARYRLFLNWLHNSAKKPEPLMQ